MIQEQAAFVRENPYPVLRIKYDGTVISANHSALETINREVIGNSIYSYFPRLKKSFMDKFTSKNMSQLEEIIGEKIFLFTFKKDTKSESFYIYGDDISDRKHAEERIKNQNVILEQAVQDKQNEMEILMERLIRQGKLATVGKISGNIAHELRNPLGAIKQSIFFLNRILEQNSMESSGSKVKEHLELIKDELDESERVISDLLQSTKINPLKKQQTNLRSIILKVLDRQPIEKNIKLNINLKPEPFQIWADPMQMRQVISNLLSNATYDIKNKRVVTISAEMLNENKICFIKIQDNGPGITPENLSKVFEPLHTSKPKGIGLGLSICKQIIENHGGTITMTSKVGKGTTVNIQLSYNNQKTNFDLN